VSRLEQSLKNKEATLDNTMKNRQELAEEAAALRRWGLCLWQLFGIGLLLVWGLVNGREVQVMRVTQEKRHS
jgi:hypothetical protein